MKKISLRLRITILTGAILILITFILTIFSIRNAKRYFVDPQLIMEKNIVELESQSIFTDEEMSTRLEASDVNLGNVSAALNVVKAQNGFSAQSILIMSVIIVLGLIVTYIIVGKALTPLTNLSQSIHQINAKNINKSIEITESNDEISSLGNSFNHMLQRLSISFEQQKRFTANVAHELKTPLTTMKTSLQVLKLDEFPGIDDYKNNADVMEESVDRLIEVISSLLSLSTDEQMDFKDEISFYELFEDIKKELQFVIQSKHVTLKLPENDFTITGNRTLLHHGFLNIIENGVKYNVDYGEVEVFLIPSKEGKLTILVKDTGIGVAPEDMEHVTEPFYRADNSRSKDISGKGLGMSIARLVIEKHGGELYLESRLNEGTSVKVIL